MQFTNTFLSIWLILSLLIIQPPAPVADSPADLISAINGYRSANGIHTLNYNANLMVSAQAQADYMASTGIISHEGPGGSRPKDRAIAAGYGGGATTVFGSEIIYGGSFATVDVAMSWWKQSPNHNPWMLYDGYYDIGAGIAYSGDYVYFAVTMFYTTGSSGPVATLDPNVTAAPTITTGPLIIPVVAATEAEDGSIIHIVRTGQSMWNISAVYGVDLQTLYDLNGMTKWDFILPGDEILVKPPDNYSPETKIAAVITDEDVTPDGSQEPDAEETPENPEQDPLSATPTRTKAPSSTPTSRYTLTPTEPIILNLNGTLTPTASEDAHTEKEAVSKNTIVIGIVSAAVIAILLISIFKKPDQEDDFY